MKKEILVLGFITIILFCGCIGEQKKDIKVSYPSALPIYIAYAEYNCKDTFYTINYTEYVRAISTAWNEDKNPLGTAGFLLPTQENGTIPLYRSWNGCKHFYTTDRNKFNESLKHGYKAEHIAGYVIPGYEPSLTKQEIQE